MRHIALRLFTALALAFGLLNGCAVMDHAPGAHLEAGARWAVVPFANATETPLAGQRAEAVSEALLRTLGVREVLRYPAELSADSLFDNGARKSEAAALDWARGAGVRYVLTGTVDEWRYKVGVDGEPAVGVALHVIDLQDDRVVWSAVGAKSGWSRESLSGVGQKLIRSLLAPAIGPR